MACDVVDYAVSVAKRHCNEIGFLPRPRLEQYRDRGQLWHADENGEPCGFLVWGNGWPVLRVYQVCIQYDAQRRHHGIALLQRLIAFASERGYEAIACWVADDIPANDFWRSVGFVQAGRRQGGAHRGRMHNQWVYHLPAPLQLRLIA